MIATLLLQIAPEVPPRAPDIALAAAARAPARMRPVSPPSDWSHLPELPYARRVPDMDALSTFVRDEVAAGRCAASGRVGGSAVVTLDLAVMVAPGGRIRRIVPRAIDCLAVEQYGSGLVSRLARGNLLVDGIVADTWFRTTLVFSWPA
jgi:hypothetical protein